MFSGKNKPKRNNLSYIRSSRSKPRRKRLGLFNSNISTKNKKKNGHKKFVLIIILLVATILVGYLTFVSEFFKIKTVVISTENRPEGLSPGIQAIADNAKGQNLVFLNDRKIEDQIREIHSDIKNLHIQRHLPDTLEIKIIFFPELVNFIIEESPSGVEHKFVVSVTGKISRNYFENPELSQLILSDIDDESFNQILDESISFDSEHLKKAIFAKELFEKTFNIAVTANYYFKTARETHLKTDKGFFVWIDLTKNIETQILKLKKGMSKLDIYNEPLLYIDLRVGSQNGEKLIFKRLINL